MNRNKIPTRVQSSSLDKIHHVDKFTSTPPELSECVVCKERLAAEKLSMKDYIKSINYINSCHNIINEMIKLNASKAIMMPDLPNFVNIFASLNNCTSDELNQIDSLQDIYSKIESLGLDNSTKDADSDPEREVKRKPSRTATIMEFSEDDSSAAHNKAKVRNSSIPRPVSSEGKTPAIQQLVYKQVTQSQTAIAGQHKSKGKTGRESHKALKEEGPRRNGVDSNKYKHNYTVEKQQRRVRQELVVSRVELNDFPEDSCTDTANSSPLESPASIERRQQYPRAHKNTIVKTTSEHSLKIVPKPRAKSSSMKPGKYKQRSPERKESPSKSCDKSPKKPEPVDAATNRRSLARKQVSSAESPRRSNSAKKKADNSRRIKSQHVMSSPKTSWPRTKTIASESAPDNFDNDDSDIEPDEVHDVPEFVKSASHIKKPQKLKNTVKRVNISQPEMTYFSNNKKSNEAFAKRKQGGLKGGESEMDTDKDVNCLYSESDIDEDMFENSTITEAADLLLYNKNGRPASAGKAKHAKGPFSNVGWKMPAKICEWEESKKSRENDKQNITFRQPRQKEHERMNMGDAARATDDNDGMSASSSQIKQDADDLARSHYNCFY